MKTHWTKKEVLDVLEDMRAGVITPSQYLIELIMYIERLFYNKHAVDIHKRQDKLEYLIQDANRFVAFWFGGKLRDDIVYRTWEELISPGCRACLTSLITHVRHSYKCSQSCDFCYYRNKPIEVIGKGLYKFSGHDMAFTLQEAKLLVDRQLINKTFPYGAVGWLQKEPLEELDSIFPLMEYIAKTGMHQYMYTNGIKATYPVVDKLANSGLKELRFNLMSTKFSDKVIDYMGYASTTIPWTLIETPMYSESYKLFVEKRDAILSTNVKQINLPELQICSYEALDLFKSEGPAYKHRRGYVSPISSRHYTYDLIELAEEENWPVIINDCSNDTKFYRGVNNRNSLGYIDYPSLFELPFDSVAYLAEQVLEDGETYEFF